MSRPTQLMMPREGSSRGSDAIPVELDGAASSVIVGANGSGKTRLGSWLEFVGPQHRQVYRVGAQKSLMFPERVSPLDVSEAQLGLTYGMYIDLGSLSDANVKNFRAQLAQPQGYQNIKRSKWGQQPETGQMNDYKALVTYLLSEQAAAGVAYLQESAGSASRITPPTTKIGELKRIWERILPHRQLIAGSSSVSVKPSDTESGTEYQAPAMSDGERVVFYLIGQCLSAPENNIIVIDEPEIHLHRAIQTRLWNAIEQERPDCLFVYLTHDLEFAASRVSAKKFWIKSYDGQVWDWEEVPDPGKMPEALLLAVLGSRKPVLFTEGEAGGYEQAIFSRVYPDWTIMPCGNCEQVIDATQSFTNLKDLHGNECRGIIDRDYRDEHNVIRLQAQGILVLQTQEIENLMLDEAVLTAVLEHAIGTGAIAGTRSERLSVIKTHLFRQLARDQEMLTTKRASWEIEKGLRQFGTVDGAIGLAAIQQAVTATCALPVADIYKQIDQEFARIITEQDYPALLRLYNNKGLAKRIGQFFNFREPFPDYFKRLLSIQGNDALVQALKVACPTLPAVAASTPLT